MPNPFSERPVGETVQPCPLQQRNTPVHWIEIELVGEDDKPIPYEEYRIRLPDETEVEGYLDQDGFARLDQLPSAGNCQVCFPNLDKDAWEFIESIPARKDVPSK